MTGAISIRPVCKDDADALASLHGSCFSKRWSVACFEWLVDDGSLLAKVETRSGALRK